MRLVPLLAVVSLSLVCDAQSTKVQVPAPGSQAATTVIVRGADSQGCPIGFQARHAGDGGLVQVSPGQRRHSPGYQLTFSGLNGSGISQVRVTLHGMAGAHVIPAGKQSFPDATESFNLSPADGAKAHLFRSTVYTEKLTGVEWIELNEVTYADGTHWQASETATCHITPNGFMLVGASK